MTDRDPLYRRHPFPAKMIARAVWLCSKPGMVFRIAAS
ncbi:hypothetical protein RHI9324_02512 [Rhizobium sp. CECT 9324]|nr:hypothetical protein RHI9324_02512 [Rhizobium sp. CECT 9324]